MIKTVTKKHPWRDIILDFDDAIQAPTFETEALTMYYEAHDKIWSLYEHGTERIEKMNKADALMQDLYFRRLGLEQELDLLEEALELKAQDTDLKIDSEFTIDVNAFFEAADRHSADLQELYQMIDELTHTYNDDIDKIYEDDYLIDPKYFEIFDDIWARYEELSVHTVSLDDDYQDFLEANGKVDEMYFGYIDRAQVLFEEYAKSLPSHEEAYRRVERVQVGLKDKFSGLDLPE